MGPRARRVLVVLLAGIAAAVAASPSADAGPLGGPLQLDVPLGEPSLVEGPARLAGRRVTAWAGPGTVTYLLLEGDAEFAVGAYAFEATTAVVRIETERRPGQTLRHVWAVLDEASSEGFAITASSADAPLLVTGSVVGDVELQADALVESTDAPSRALVAEALSRFDRRSRRLAGGTFEVPGLEALAESTVERAEAGRRARTEAVERAAAGRGVSVPELAAAEAGRAEAPVLPSRGVVRFRADRFDYQTLEDGPAAVLIGDVTVLYQDYGRSTSLTLRADRAVIFLDASATRGAGEAPASAVRGVYLEGHALASDGSYTVRAPRAYYDVGRNRAVLLDAVLYSFDVERELPLYVRADMLRQTAAGTFRAQGAVFTTSEFGVPHFAIGAGRLTVRQVEPRPGVSQAAFRAKDITLRVDDTPVFWLPFAAGRTGEIPLRSVRAGFSDNNGPQLETEWDAFALLGRTPREGVDAEIDLDFRGERGPGLGGRLDYDQPGFRGEIEAYTLPIDGGEDEIADRMNLDRDDELRGLVDARHRQDLPGRWELSVEASAVSDETFLEAFFPDRAYEAKPFEISAYLKWQDQEQAFTALLKANPNNFIPQLAELQAPGSVTDKLPEFGYHRTGTPLLGGRLTWFSETSAGVIRQRFGEDTPADRGFTDAQSQALFGIDSDTPFDDAADAQGLDNDVHFRFDTREEIAFPIDLGPVRAVPYLTGRFTAYEDDFGDYRGEDEFYRLLGVAGVRLKTSFSKVYPGVRDRLFDLDGVRHVVTPQVEAFYLGSTLDAGGLPPLDPDIESLAEGGGVRVGVLQTFETRRGGPARSRNALLAQVRTDLVLRYDNDFDEEAAVPRYVPYRPEYTLGGDHAYTEVLWMVTDSLGVVGEATYALENDGFAQWRVGTTYDATPRLRFSAGYTEIDPIPSRVLSLALRYQLTRKYLVGATQSFDFADSDDDSASGSFFLERALPRWRMRVFGSVDQLDGDFAVGLLLAPQGLGSGGGVTF